MIRFLRRIRQNSLFQGQLRKYLAYAIGEILLIVAGILIALQVNDYNESQKIKSAEKRILENFIACLQDDLSTINYNIDKHSKAIVAGETLLEVFRTGTPYHDSLSLYFAGICYYTNFMSNIGAYESLQGKGMDIISNNKLRFSIVNLYEKWYPIARFNDERLADDIFHLKRSFLQDHFDKFQVFHPDELVYLGEMTPLDFNHLRDEAQYQYFLKSLIADHRSVILFYEHIRTKAQYVIDQSLSEIQELDD